jgi:putative addiction module antidote
MLEAKIITVGSQIACVLPREAVERLGAKDGDTVLVTETSEGIALASADEEFRKKMAIAEDVMRRYDNTLRELAK